MKKLKNCYYKTDADASVFLWTKVEICRWNDKGIRINWLEYITEWSGIGVMENGRNDTDFPFCYQETVSRTQVD
jgi:hypothetical protein